MAKENLNKEPIVDALRELGGQFKLDRAELIIKNLEVSDQKDKNGNVTGSIEYYKLSFLVDHKYIFQLTGSRKIADDLVLGKSYNVGFNMEKIANARDAQFSNQYKAKIADYREALL